MVTNQIKKKKQNVLPVKFSKYINERNYFPSTVWKICVVLPVGEKITFVWKNNDSRQQFILKIHF